MFVSLKGAVNFLELERELFELTGVRSGQNTWFLKNNHIIFVDSFLKKTHEFHKYTDGTLSPVCKLIKKHKTVSSQIERLRRGKMLKLEARVRRIISKRYTHRDEMNALLLGIENKKDSTYLEYLNFLVKLNSKAEQIKQAFLRLPHRTKKDLEKLTNFPINITADDIIRELK